MSNQPIGVFDSGVGGLSILRELQKILPHENFVFLADQAHVPYGEKNKKELNSLVDRITKYFVREHGIKFMVVACNTATCYTIDSLREKYSFPIIGTVPAIKPASEQTKTKVIAVMSTPATSKSRMLADLIKNYSKDVTVINIGCYNLENVVEKGKVRSPQVKKLLSRFLDPLQGEKVDHIVLGCTHYPFLKSEIKKVVGEKITLIDSGEAIARYTRELLAKKALQNTSRMSGKTQYVTTGNALQFSKVIWQLLRKKVKTTKIKV